MTPLIKILSTDFDGTLHSEHEDPPVPVHLQKLIARLQARGVKWVINTGRDLSALMEGIARAELSILPDYVVVVEREIYRHHESRFIADEDWNGRCTKEHATLFASIRADLPGLIDWVEKRFIATVYSDPYSPFCLIAGHNHDADAILAHLETYSQGVPNLTVVRNDVYARFSHRAYNKGTALAEISRQLDVGPEHILAAGDHFNDLPMLSREHAHRLVAPANAVPAVKEVVRKLGGFVSDLPWGHGVARGLESLLAGESD
ncbi:MAG: HAD family phosphatase [Verrucomicrobia bacterium]|nr:HAD family phosphatase [Verrucomicrobiota bacterium]